MRIIALLLAVLALAAAPFFSAKPLGTGEAYNYSLAVADTVVQFRAGELPVLVGQSEFAFNGRIHPLRTAPALPYLAGLLDLLTLRQLSYWSLQNLVLGLALVGGGLLAYWSLRRVTPATPGVAAALAAAYIGSPAVLAAAYGMDLYMTVLTVPCVPVILAANFGCCQGHRSRDLPLLAIALGACWLAHPPIALWMTLTTAVLQAASLAWNPPAWRDVPAFAGAAALLVLLAGFVFASVLTLVPDSSVTKAYDLGNLFAEVQRSFPATFRPISPHANTLGDFQLGYLGWAVVASAAGLATIRRRPLAALALGTAALLYIFTAPVPFLHERLWRLLPGVFFNLTNQWPMQRLYLPITALAGFALALAWAPGALRPAAWRDLVRLAVAALVCWTGWQSWQFVSRGFASRAVAGARAMHLSANIDLTPISYALLQGGAGAMNGVIDPGMEFRLLRPHDAAPIDSNWDAPMPPSPENRTGRLVAKPVESSPHVLDFGTPFLLQPGAHYRLRFQFQAKPGLAYLQITGPTLFRQFELPASGGSRAFGMMAPHNPALTLWTDQATPESVDLRLTGDFLSQGPWRSRPFADYTFERIDPAALPFQVLSLVPLKVRVRAREAGYLETPRVFIPGYAATVNGRPFRTQASPAGALMVQIPAGESMVEVRYPGPLLVRVAFWAGLATWLGVGVWGATRLLPAARREAWTARVRATGASLARHVTLRRLGVAAVAAAILAGAALGWRAYAAKRDAVGPIRVRFVLPRGETNRQQPLVVTGQPGAGAFYYVQYQDERHVRIGVDVWGLFGGITDPIETDYFGEHELVVSSGALYPADHPKVRDLPVAERERLMHRIEVSYDGRVVLSADVRDHASAPGDVTVGVNRIGGSSCEPRFAGQIIETARLPLPARP